MTESGQENTTKLKIEISTFQNNYKQNNQYFCYIFFLLFGLHEKILRQKHATCLPMKPTLENWKTIIILVTLLYNNETNK